VVVAHPAAAEEEEEHPGWMLVRHSFEKTLTYDDRLGDWLSSASTMALRNRVQLMPPVPDRYGLFWNKRAASTKNFEVTFNFRAMPQRKGKAEDGLFALWISPDNFTATYDEQSIVTMRNWTQGLHDAGLTFISNRPTFRGLAVIFLGLDRKGAQRPSVTAVMCDGKSELKMSDYPEKKDAQVGHHQTKYIDWRKPDVEVKIRAMFGGVVVGSIKIGKSKQHQEIFRLPAEEAGSWMENYFGFSGWTGSDSYLELDMSRIQMRNFDLKRVGEEKQAGDSADGMDEEFGDVEKWKEVLEQEKRYIDQKSQKEAVERLTNLLGDYVDRYNKMGEKVKSELIYLEKRMASLDAEVNFLIGSSHAVDPESGALDVSSLQDHIRGIKTILTKDRDSHSDKITEVHSVAKILKEKGGDVLGSEGRAKVESIAAASKSLEKHVESGASQTSWLLMVLIVAVCVLGLLFLNRMRYYEKKHYI